MAKIRIVGDSSGYVELAAPNAAGNNTLELPASGTKLVGADTGNNLNVTGIVTATTVSTGSGTSISSPATNVLALGTNNSERVRIDSSGNLGIGTNSPSEVLHLLKTGATSTNIRFQNSSGNVFVGNDNDGDAFVSADTNGKNLKLYTSGGTERLRITSTGNIGINTTNPQFKLSVYSTGAARNEIVCTDNNAGGSGVYLRTLNNGSQVSNATLRTTNSGIFEVYTGTTSETIKLSIDTTGNLITTSNIGAGLDIGYKRYASVTGTYSANTWYNTGISWDNGDTGIFLLNAYVDTYACGGVTYQTTYTGLFTIPNRATNDSRRVTFPVHYCGHAQNGEVLQFGTLISGSNTPGIQLQWLSSSNYTVALNNTGGKQLYIAVNRLATALFN